MYPNESLRIWIKKRFFVWMLGGGGQNLERQNVEEPIFRNFEIANIQIKKDELFDNFIFERFIFNFLEII